MKPTLPAGIAPPVVSVGGLSDRVPGGLDGSGETIAIIDAFGSTTVQQDLAAFATRMGLPPANLQIINASYTRGRDGRGVTERLSRTRKR